MTTLLGELSAYYANSFPAQIYPNKTLLVSEGNSYSSAGKMASKTAKEYLDIAVGNLGNLDLRSLGVSSSTTTGAAPSLADRATYVDAFPAKCGTSLASSVLVVGEGANQPGAFTAFATYISDRLAAGWGKIVIIPPTVTSGWAGGDANVTAFYNSVMSYSWPANVMVADSRQGVLATYNATYFADGVHENDAGHAALASLVQPSLVVVDITKPIVATAIIPTTGDRVDLSFSESVKNVNSADYATVGLTFGAAAGSGAAWYLPITSGTVYQGPNKALAYSGNRTADLSDNLMNTFSGLTVTNNSTVPVPDTTPPAVPALTALAGNTLVLLTWIANTDDTTGYELDRNGSTIDEHAALSYLDTSLTNGIARTYRLRAYDAAGNRSAWSAAQTVTPNDPANGGRGSYVF